MNENRLGVALVAVPVLHVLSTSIYLWAYTIGFGSNLAAFVAASDLFGTSISVMVRVYITSLLLPFIFSAYRYLPGYKPPGLPFTGEKAFKKTRQLYYVFWVFAVVIIGFTEFKILSRGEPFNFTLLNMAFIVTIGPLIIDFNEKFAFSKFFRDLFYIGTLFFISAFCFGMDAGANDRRHPYTRYRSGLARCERFSVIRKIDDYYLAILPSSRKALIDDDCKIKIRFPLTKIDQ